MSIMKCSECDKEVSNKADACPHRGNPISQPKAESVETVTRIDTIEHTRKKWKAWKLSGGIMMIVGIPMSIIIFANGMASVFSSTAGPNPVWLFIGIILSVVGFIAFLIGAIGAWWQHG